MFSLFDAFNFVVLAEATNIKGRWVHLICSVWRGKKRARREKCLPFMTSFNKLTNNSRSRWQRDCQETWWVFSARGAAFSVCMRQKTVYLSGYLRHRMFWTASVSLKTYKMIKVNYFRLLERLTHVMFVYDWA